MYKSYLTDGFNRGRIMRMNTILMVYHGDKNQIDKFMYKSYPTHGFNRGRLGKINGLIIEFQKKLINFNINYWYSIL